jgi:hypothetical protein
MKKKLRHFTWPEDLRILALFSDLQNSRFKHTNMASKVSQLFQSIAVRIAERAPRRQKGLQFSRPVRVQVEFCNSKKSARFFVRSCADLCEGIGGKSGCTSHGLERYFQVEFSNLKKVTESWRS